MPCQPASCCMREEIIKYCLCEMEASDGRAMLPGVLMEGQMGKVEKQWCSGDTTQFLQQRQKTFLKHLISMSEGKGFKEEG